MIIGTYICGSCAVNSITSLGEHKGPVDAMKAFCKAELRYDNKFAKADHSFKTLTNYYVFCAGPEVKTAEPGGSHHSKDHWPKYGTEFAQYIRDNGLGEVSTVGPKLNLRHHKNTTAQAWLWSPDQKAMERWWATQQAGVEVKIASNTRSVPVIEPDIDDDYDEDDEDYDDCEDDDDYDGDEDRY